MSFYIYEKDSTLILRIIRNRSWTNAEYQTRAAAQAALTRLRKQDKLPVGEWLVADAVSFQRSIEKTKTVKNLMSGKEITIPVNTPRSCDPSSELYWSM